MKTRLSAIAAAALLAGSMSAHAQSSGTVLPGGAQAPKGQLSTPNQDKGGRPQGMSTESRPEVKAEAKDARRSGQLPAGEQSTPSQGKAASKPGMSSESRAEVKAEAKDARRAGEIPAGERAQNVPPKK